MEVDYLSAFLPAPDEPTIEGQFDAPGTGLANANVFLGVVTPFGVFWARPGGLTVIP